MAKAGQAHVPTRLQRTFPIHRNLLPGQCRLAVASYQLTVIDELPGGGQRYAIAL